ncbi:MAG: HAMP domain-containing histidine kinase, partial [archaeon]|nr:HAMP domain-containing histidine kinase [archaeon]
WLDHYTQTIIYEGKKATLLMFIDASDKKEAENLIQEENQRLLELNKIRKDLISRASHELKTPLIAVYGASQMLSTLYRNQVVSDAHEFVDMIHRGAQRLKNLIDNLLDASRIESGKLILKIENENIVSICKECIDDMRYLADQKSLSINLDFPEEYFLTIDKIRIEQVITNLMSNAIKNTPRNGRIDMKFIENKNWIDLHIIDTGIGLTDKEKKLLFKRFGKIERIVNEPSVDIEGSGLGLVISKEIAELHGGKILFESEGRNKGCKFTLRLFKEKIKN